MFKIISNEFGYFHVVMIKALLGLMPVVFPAVEGKIYNEIAQQCNFELNPEELLSSEILNEKIVYRVLTL